MSVDSLADDGVLPGRSGRERAAPSPLLEVGNSIGRLYKEAFGRGPTRVRAMFAGMDIVVVVLHDVLTSAERTLVALGQVEQLSKSRLTIQQALEERARLAAEVALGRRTVAFITAIDPRYGLAVNVFTLEPAVEDGHEHGAPGRWLAAR